ncbi:MAG: ferrous iron transport protein A [Candidatus Altiarchaeales archaeon]|nr:ferrous iron transport protein A [Candidatus Altiarchaeales archaeon]
MKSVVMKTLLEVNKGESVVVRELSGGRQFTGQLRTMGVKEGSRVKLVTREPFGGPLVIKTGNTTLTLGRGKASKILVE